MTLADLHARLMVDPLFAEAYAEVADLVGAELKRRARGTRGQVRVGKIARCPHAVREQLNRRLRDGDKGKALVAWLNELPAVKEMLARLFKGKPIREQSLSEWRKGGFQDWLAKGGTW